MKELIEIQSRLNAPKNLYNSFGKYKYRSAEGILEAVKPLLKELGCQLTISDEVVFLGNRFYIKATATLTNGNEKETTSAYAREDEQKKGMDGSQITGTASSYARKYALNGLFCIDDSKDADTDEYQKQQEGKKAKATETKLPDGMQPVMSLLERAQKDVDAADTKEALLAVWDRYKTLQTDPTFSKAMSARKKQVMV